MRLEHLSRHFSLAGKAPGVVISIVNKQQSQRKTKQIEAVEHRFGISDLALVALRP